MSADPTKQARPRTPRRRRSSLFWRLFFGIGAMISIAVVLVALLTMLSARRWDPEWVEATAASIREIVLDDASDESSADGADERPRRRLPRPDSPDLQRMETALRELGEALDADLRVVRLGALRRGGAITGNALDGELDPQKLRRLARGETVVLPRGRWNPPRLLVPSAFTDDLPRLVVVVDPHPRFMWRRVLVAVASVVLALGAWILARGMTGRIAALEAHADALSRGELDHPIPLAARGPGDELDALAEAFAEMSERIRELLSGQRRLLTNVSHELRTPLARMKVQLELLADELGESPEEHTPSRGDLPPPSPALRHVQALRREVDETAVLVDDLLASGRLELGGAATLRRDVVDLAALARDRASLYAARVVVDHVASPDPHDPTSADATTRDTSRAPQAIAPVVSGDRALLARVVDNLLANARRASGAGDVVIAVDRDAAGLRLSVTDDGPGVPPASRDAIFQPFVRLDDARSRDGGGAGLGLFLARQIAEAHGGSLHVCERPDGLQGARFELRLPLPPPPSA